MKKLIASIMILVLFSLTLAGCFRLGKYTYQVPKRKVGNSAPDAFDR